MLKYEYPEHVYAATSAKMTSRNEASEKSSDEADEEDDEDTLEFFSNQEFLRGTSSADPNDNKTGPSATAAGHGVVVKEGRAYIEGGSRY